MKKPGVTTRLVHTSFPLKDPHGSLNFPVYDSVAYEFDSSEDLEDAFTGRVQKHQYSRITNPTVEYFEQKVKSLTGAEFVMAMSSGMAAISNLILAISASGKNIVTSRHLFGNTISLFEHTLKPYMLETRYADLTDVASVEALVDEQTVAIFMETITNPQMEVANISELAELARRKEILLIADTTLTPPSIFSAHDHGIHIEVLSSTKFISGGATSVGGLLIDYGSYDWSKLEKTCKLFEEHGQAAFKMMFKKTVYRNLGACMSPHNAYLQSLGLDTLALRTERATTNALKLASWLEERGEVKRVDYPGLKSHPAHAAALQQFGPAPCSIFTFDLESKSSCYRFMNGLRLARRATNLQDNKTLVIHPYSTIFAEYDGGQKATMGLRDTCIRISVGIEDLEDLMDDVQQALNSI